MCRCANGKIISDGGGFHPDSYRECRYVDVQMEEENLDIEQSPLPGLLSKYYNQTSAHM
jgi:hypothetical protein